jgi:hypothetical protein
MTISSDAFAQYPSVPCFKHQLKTWHEHEREIFFSAMRGFLGQANDLGSRFFPSDDSYSGLMFPAVTMRPFLDRSSPLRSERSRQKNRRCRNKIVPRCASGPWRATREW